MDKVYMIVPDESAGAEPSGPTRVAEEALMQIRWNDEGLVSGQRCSIALSSCDAWPATSIVAESAPCRS